MALPVIFLASCHDDDDLPDVNMGMELSGGVVADGSIYVVEGDTLFVDSVSITSNITDKTAAIIALTYRLDGWPFVTVGQMPFATMVPTYNLEVGEHKFGFEGPIVQESKTPATAYSMYRLIVVSDSTQIPVTGTTRDIVDISINKEK